MSRNGSGTMSVINSFSANTTIESAKVNQNFTDIASELTGSLPRDGQAAMTGQMKAASGSVTAPAMTFSSDLDTGLYYIGANNFGLACNGAKVLDVSTTGLAVTGTLSATGAISKAGVNVECFAAATAMLFYQNTAPTGWTIVTASINDKALRVVSGSGAGGGTGGATGGTTAFTSVFAARTLAANQLPNMTLTVTDAGHTHDTTVPSGSGGGNKESGTNRGSNTSYTSDSATTGISVAIDNTSRGGGAQQTIDFAVQYASVVICTKD